MLLEESATHNPKVQKRIEEGLHQGKPAYSPTADLRLPTNRASSGGLNNEISMPKPHASHTSQRKVGGSVSRAQRSRHADPAGGNSITRFIGHGIADTRGLEPILSEVMMS
jgi:hypothetical protein